MSCTPKNVRTPQNSLDGLADGLNQPHLKVTSPSDSSSTSACVLEVRRFGQRPDRALALLDLHVNA